jgi:pyruvate/2-oxoglutarate dehydrogenase complex dihydrolipoamide dehydrogenase (E3) component
VLLETEVLRVEGLSGQQVRVHVKDANGERAIEGTDLLVAVGRVPNTQGIGLDQTGVELDSRGYIKVNERLETTAPSVWAVGDCAGSPQFTHVAFDDFRVIRDNLSGGNRTTLNRLIPFCIFTDPELARVGLNESQAKSRGAEYRVVKMPMAAVFRAEVLSEPRGFLKMLIDKHSDRIPASRWQSFKPQCWQACHTQRCAMPSSLIPRRLKAWYVCWQASPQEQHNKQPDITA